jgi:hypothetical protein
MQVSATNSLLTISMHDNNIFSKGSYESFVQSNKIILKLSSILGLEVSYVKATFTILLHNAQSITLHFTDSYANQEYMNRIIDSILDYIQ